jgi:hypothetical protein
VNGNEPGGLPWSDLSLLEKAVVIALIAAPIIYMIVR